MNALQDISRLGVPDHSSAQLVAQLQHDSSDYHQRVKSQELSADRMTGCAAQTQVGQVPQHSVNPSADGHYQKSDPKSVGPWVVSNRKVQKRYRERRKAEKESMEQQLDALTLQLESMKAKITETAGHNSALDKAIAFKDYEVAKLQESNHVMDTASLPGDASTALHNTASIKSSTRSNVIHEYKLIVKGMVGLMLRLSNEGSSPALMQDLNSAASTLVLLFMHTFIYSAHDAARLMKANLEHDHYEAAPASSAHADPKQLWQGITDKLQLQPGQRRQMVILRQHFLQSLTECHDSREAICLGLQQETQKVQTAYDTIETDAQAYVLSMLELHRESSQLRNNLRRQHRIWMDFYATIFKLWDARQTCCVAVHSFPRFPDLLAISSCVAINDDSCGPDGQPYDKSFRTHKLEMKRSPRYTHRLLADSSSGLQPSAHGRPS